MQQIYAAASKVDLTFGLPDLSTALKQIQSQYDSIAAKNLKVGSRSLMLKTHVIIIVWPINSTREIQF